MKTIQGNLIHLGQNGVFDLIVHMAAIAFARWEPG